MALSAAHIDQTSVNPTLIVSFMEIMEDDEVLSWLSVRILKSQEFLEWRGDSDIPPAREIVRVPNDKVCRPVQRRSVIAKQMKTTMFNKCDNLVLGELGTEYVHQILCACAAVQTYGLKDEGIVYMVLQMFCDKQCTVSYVNGSKYLQRVVQTFQRHLSSSEEFNVHSTLEVLLLLHAVSFVICRVLSSPEEGKSTAECGRSDSDHNRDSHSKDCDVVQGPLPSWYTAVTVKIRCTTRYIRPIGRVAQLVVTACERPRSDPAEAVSRTS